MTTPAQARHFFGGLKFLGGRALCVCLSLAFDHFPLTVWTWQEWAERWGAVGRRGTRRAGGEGLRKGRRGRNCQRTAGGENCQREVGRRDENCQREVGRRGENCQREVGHRVRTVRAKLRAGGKGAEPVRAKLRAGGRTVRGRAPPGGGELSDGKDQARRDQAGRTRRGDFWTLWTVLDSWTPLFNLDQIWGGRFSV